jgi:hypothetical protein
MTNNRFVDKLPQTSDGGGLIDLTNYNPTTGLLDRNYINKSASFPICEYCDVQLTDDPGDPIVFWWYSLCKEEPLLCII